MIPNRLIPNAPLRAIVALLFLAVLAACGKSGPKTNADGTKSVKLALNWVPEPEFGGFYSARETGAYRNEKLTVEIQGGGAGVPVLQMVASGKADFGIVGGDEVITARDKGVDIVVLFATYQTSPQGIMVHEERGAATLKDVLASGQIGMEPGLPYAQFLKKKYGEFGAKVVPYDGGVAHFVADKEYAQQCYITSEPLAARKQGAKPKVFLVADEGYNPYVGVVITSKSFAKDNPEIVKGFVRATRVGWRDYLADPSAANAAMAAINTSMDIATFKAASEAQKILVTGGDDKNLGVMTKDRWETLATQLHDIGVVSKKVDIDFLYEVD
ncbi:MAG: ABC transporter substrate-binding protein [Polyangiaceae bacterium]